MSPDRLILRCNFAGLNLVGQNENRLIRLASFLRTVVRPEGTVAMSEAREVLEQAIEYWNAGDRDAWARLYAEDVVYQAPAASGFQGWRTCRRSTSTHS
jgi:hypothetical protein